MDSPGGGVRAEPGPAQLAELVRSRSWYHTIELAPGLATPGYFDTRAVAPRLPLPASLAGKRCLDVGTFDGFWAFEMERRGAAEVTAIDILDPRQWDWPAGSEQHVLEAIDERKDGGGGFEIAARAIGSSVRRLECSIYDLDPGVHGEFDFVYVGSLLLHLRDPVRALEAVRSVCRGQTLVFDAIDPLSSLVFRRRPMAILDGVGRPWWWKPNAAGLVQLVRVAGFRVLAGPQRLYIPLGEGARERRVRLRELRVREGRDAAFRRRIGDPHAAVLAEPAA